MVERVARRDKKPRAFYTWRRTVQAPLACGLVAKRTALHHRLHTVHQNKTFTLSTPTWRTKCLLVNRYSLICVSHHFTNHFSLFIFPPTHPLQVQNHSLLGDNDVIEVLDCRYYLERVEERVMGVALSLILIGISHIGSTHELTTIDMAWELWRLLFHPVTHETTVWSRWPTILIRLKEKNPAR